MEKSIPTSREWKVPNCGVSKGVVFPIPFLKFILQNSSPEQKDRDDIHYCWRVKSSFKLV
jgi:hypothetical protein